MTQVAAVFLSVGAVGVHGLRMDASDDDEWHSNWDSFEGQHHDADQVEWIDWDWSQGEYSYDHPDSYTYQGDTYASDFGPAPTYKPLDLNIPPDTLDLIPLDLNVPSDPLDLNPFDPNYNNFGTRDRSDFGDPIFPEFATRDRSDLLHVDPLCADAGFPRARSNDESGATSAFDFSTFSCDFETSLTNAWDEPSYEPDFGFSSDIGGNPYDTGMRSIYASTPGPCASSGVSRISAARTSVRIPREATALDRFSDNFERAARPYQERFLQSATEGLASLQPGQTLRCSVAIKRTA